jgi:hypothetical protein
MIKPKGRAQEHRDKIRKKFFPGEDAWTGENEKGWFKAPRTLPLVLALISSKVVSGKLDPTRAYLELWSRHMGEGIIEMRHEGEHAYAAGYVGTRGIRTWQERMKLLEAHGIIKTKQIGGLRYKYVLLVHPTAVVEKLRQGGKVPSDWLDTYRDRQLETKELTYDLRKKAKSKSGPKVVTMGSLKVAVQKSSAS